MAHSCAAMNCSSTSSGVNIGKDVSFFRFPKDESRCKIWVRNCRRKDLKSVSANDLNRSYRLCSKHFEPSQYFDTNIGGKRKIISAIPTIFNFPNPPPLIGTKALPTTMSKRPAEFRFDGKKKLLLPINIVRVVKDLIRKTGLSTNAASPVWSEALKAFEIPVTDKCKRRMYLTYNQYCTSFDLREPDLSQNSMRLPIKTEDDVEINNDLYFNGSLKEQTCSPDLGKNGSMNDVMLMPQSSQSTGRSVEGEKSFPQKEFRFSKDLTLESIRQMQAHFAEERNWTQFHTPRNLLLAMVGEVGEVSELFQWRNEAEVGLPDWTQKERTHLSEELSDVLIYLVRLAEQCHVDLPAAVLRKIALNGKKYPTDKVYGSSKKYTEYVNDDSPAHLNNSHSN